MHGSIVEFLRDIPQTGTVVLQIKILPKSISSTISSVIEDWKNSGKVERLWKRDSTLWTNSDEGDWLGWLDVVENQLTQTESLRVFENEVRSGNFRDAVVLGMGGSSLCARVFATSFAAHPNSPILHVLDSTDPAQIKTLQNRINNTTTLFIIASKSGTTFETTILWKYFFESVKKVVGASQAGKNFVAVTDPKSKLQKFAEKNGFRHIFHSLPSIGGRYSALSTPGVIPATVMGIDVARLLKQARKMVLLCSPKQPAEENPGVVLGAILGCAAMNGFDKVTITTSPSIRAFGAWLEQLLAESTGKRGVALIPIDQEPPGPPEAYGNDRLFVYVRLMSAFDSSQDRTLKTLADAGHPVVQITIGDVYDLGGEFFRWEIATTVAASIMGVNPFDQPDVDSSKKFTHTLMKTYKKTRRLSEQKPLYEVDGLKLFTDNRNSSFLVREVGIKASLGGYLRAHFHRLRPGDYLGILAYLEMNIPHQQKLQEIRQVVRNSMRVATCLGFGPMFLHSTGQAYKGGPNSGVFLQITCREKIDLAVPDEKYSFGIVKTAQAQGDFHVLAQRNRRVLRVHLGIDVIEGLSILQSAIEQAVAN